MELRTIEVSIGFSASLIPISSPLHYSFKAGKEEKQGAGGHYEKVDQGTTGRMGDERSRGVLEISGPIEKREDSAPDTSAIHMNTADELGPKEGRKDGGQKTGAKTAIVEAS